MLCLFCNLIVRTLVHFLLRIHAQDVITVQSAIRAHLCQKQYLQYLTTKLDDISGQEDNSDASTDDAVEVIQSVLRGHLTRQDVLNK